MGASCFKANITKEEREQLETRLKQNKLVDKFNENRKENESKIPKVLLLGAGESGKSTIFKQMIKLYGKGFSKELRLHNVQYIIQNVSNAVEVLSTQISILKDELKAEVAEETKKSIEFLKLHLPLQAITNEIADHITIFWSDKAIKETFSLRYKFQIPDSAEYFLERVKVFAQPDFQPNDNDLLYLRAKTTGIHEEEFTISNLNFRVTDVGGQKSERKKWIHCFENVTSVIYIAAASEYDYVCIEDLKTNRMRDALDLWEETMNSRWFTTASIILFLNKRDLFEKKIFKVSLSSCFKDWKQPPPPTNEKEKEEQIKAGFRFLEKKFIKRIRKKQKIFVHLTTAVDSNNVSRVFKAIRTTITRNSLIEDGLFL